MSALRFVYMPPQANVPAAAKKQSFYSHYTSQLELDGIHS